MSAGASRACCWAPFWTSAGSPRAPRAGFPDAKALVEDLLSGAAFAWAKLSEPAARQATASDPLFHPAHSLRALADNGTPVATVGPLHPRAARAFDLEREGVILFDVDLDWLAHRRVSAAMFREFSPLPVSRRDLAIVVAKSSPYGLVEETIRACRIAELQDVLLFDVYEGQGVPAGKKSLALRLTFGRSDRTLTDAEVAGFVDAIVKALAAKLEAVLRG